jgi:hypothetical protein
LIPELAEVAATTLVAAMATSAWHTTRAAFTRVFASNPQITRELEAAPRPTAAGSQEEAVQVQRWAVLLDAALEQRPETASELQAELSRIDALSAPVVQSGHAQRDQYNISGSVTINNRG